MPFLHVTTQIEGRPGDDLLAHKVDRVAFPAIVIMDAAGAPLYTFTRAKTCARLASGSIPASVFAAKVALCERYVALRGRVAEGDTAAKVDLAVVATDLGLLDPYNIERELAGIALTPRQEAAVRQAKANGLCERFVARLRSRGSSPMIQKGIEAELLQIYKDGPHPTSDSAATYWWVVAKRGHETRNKKLLAEGIRGLEAAPGGKVAFATQLETWKAALKDL